MKYNKKRLDDQYDEYDPQKGRAIIKPLVLWAQQGGGDFINWVTAWKANSLPISLKFRWKHNLDKVDSVSWDIHANGIRIIGPVSVGTVPPKLTNAFFSIPFRNVVGENSGKFEVSIAAYTAQPPIPGESGFQTKPKLLARSEPPVTVSTISTESQAIYDYMLENSCLRKSKNDIDEEGCLENQKFHVIRKGGRGVNVHHVYRWKFSDDPPSKPLYPHFLLGYLRLLRNAVATGDSECCHIDPWGNMQSNYSCLSLLEDQLKYMESKADKPGDLIVWKQGTQYPTAMVQAEIANIYMSIAITLKDKGYDDAAYDLFVKGEKIAASLDLIQAPDNGGVRSKLYPYLGGEGWLYHSSERNGQKFALNQQAHVIRDAIYFYYHYNLFMEKLDQQMSDSKRIKLMNRFLKPLQLLASEDHSDVPNLLCFMDRKSVNGFNYYWSFYRINPCDLSGEYIKHERNCSYHKHSLDVFNGIFTAFKINSKKNRRLFNFLNYETNSEHQNMLVKINETFERLLDARRGPHGQRHVESIGKKDSNNALFQFFLSETDSRAKKDANKCSHDDLAEEVYNNYKTFFNLD
jgi:hypothetical protein